MNIPTLAGTIKRRILVNFRADPEVIQKILPEGFRPKLQNGKAIAGICLIRLENIRPKYAPEFIGIDSENAAHRIAVEWDEDGETKEGVFIPRRDTSSRLNELAGGTLFPGEHNRAEFDVVESDDAIDFAMHSSDGKIDVRIHDHRCICEAGSDACDGADSTAHVDRLGSKDGDRTANRIPMG